MRRLKGTIYGFLIFVLRSSFDTRENKTMKITPYPGIRAALLISLIALLTSIPSAFSAEPEGVAEKIDLEEQAVTTLMTQYKDAIQRLTVEGTFELFTEDSAVFEQGGVEGSYTHYVEHHLGPELGHFESFAFSDYDIEVDVQGDFAFTTETYRYQIILKPNDEGISREISKKGLATSVLKKTASGWKIYKTHSSSRALKK